MFLFLLAYIGGVLTILSPCILPVLPFVFARADQPFLRRGLPLLLGMAATFAVIATLAAVGGGWAVQANEYGRYAAIALLALFGVTLLFPELSDRLTRPLVALGGRLSESADRNEHAGSVWPSLLLGVATGLLWAPCAGPVLGLILTGAALQGANVQTTLLLLAYAAGAATSLALALLVGGRVFAAMKRSLGAGEWIRRGLGAAVLVAVAAIALGLDTGFLTQISLANTASLEQSLVDRFHPAGGKVDATPSSSVVMAGGGAMMMSGNAPTMAMNANPAGKGGAEPSSSVVTPGGGAMMSANPSMAMSANAPTMAMNGTPAGKKDAEPQSSVVSAGGGAMMSANAPTMAMNANPAAMMKAAPAAAAAENLPVEGMLPPLSGAVQWLNSPPLTAESLKGKVVLVDFWTYSCINCLRSIPYVRAWAEKYKDQGLVVIGVHAPEFPFEKNIDNVKSAVARLKIDYPVAIDNDYAIWRAFNNEYWPADYFIDAEGRIRHHYFGEGDYAESEKVIQQLLAEAGKGNLPANVVSVSATGAEAASDEADVKSPETYIGYMRAENFASPGGAVSDAAHDYSVADLKLNDWGLAGAWTVGGQYATLDKKDGAISYRFHARDLHLVLGPGADGAPVHFRVTIDGAAPGESHGADVDANGEGVVTENRLYQLVRQTGPIVDRTFTIEFLDPDVQAYAFTFG
ncbi:cytochrome c biogenesis protein DipZ [Roseiarcus sp.]|jgi:cytochrome c biogenesis protein CcdA/thiol-disulfide isomerase/thioredoxin|uniref:cytochrome c biogenesis protein DipZ n=1 Tax=Roseiarcus sp. TaxID=1969460 RepID=UPI003D113A6D